METNTVSYKCIFNKNKNFKFRNKKSNSANRSRGFDYTFFQSKGVYMPNLQKEKAVFNALNLSML